MTGALFELVWRGQLGSLAQRARRLRRPRYLIAFLLSACYFGFLVLPSLLRWYRHPFAGGGRDLGATAGEAMLLASFVAAIALAIVVTALWILSSSKPALQLSEADIDLLLPAPLSRRQVIELSLWRQQPGLILGALVLVVLRGSGPPLARLTHLFVAWSLLTLTNLHTKGVSLWKARLKEIPKTTARAWIAAAIAVGVAFWTALVLGVRGAILEVVHAAPSGWTLNTSSLHDLVVHLASRPPLVLAILLTPFRWLATAVLIGVRSRAGLPGDVGENILTAVVLSVLVIAHYEWVVRSRARFEDATIERARRQAQRRTRQPALPAPKARARQQEPFALAPLGPPEVAILWKNLLIGSRQPLSRRAAMMVLPGVVAWAFLAATGASLSAVISVGGSALALMFVIPLVGGLRVRQDLRMDLLQFEVLRAWPLRGWRLLAGEILAPTTNILTWTGAAWGLLLGATVAATAQHGREGQFLAAVLPEHWLPAAAPVATILALSSALFLVGAAIGLLSITVQNIAALSFPGWVTLGPQRPTGPGMTGQRMLMLIAQLLILAVGLLPSLLLCGALLAAGNWAGLTLAPWQVPFLALLGCLPLLAEIVVLVRLGGLLWDRLDPSEEVLAPPA